MPLLIGLCEEQTNQSPLINNNFVSRRCNVEFVEQLSPIDENIMKMTKESCSHCLFLEFDLFPQTMQCRSEIL